jgi:ABC-2 type transport system ATP-binding protein
MIRDRRRRRPTALVREWVEERDLQMSQPRAAGPLPLRVIGLGRHYRRRGPWALRHVDLEFPPLSVTAVVGPNGAGKSTLLRACVGFERPDEGRVEVFGESPRRRPKETLPLAAYIPQTVSLYSQLRIADHFVLAAAARPGFDHGYAMSRLEDEALTGARPVGELSGGEKAKVALAIALGTSAPLLLLDEPLASLDPLARREFLGFVSSGASQRARTVVLASHVIDEIEQVCDRLVVLGHGEVLFQGTIADAKAGFRTVTEPGSHDAVVGQFIGREGDALALIRSDTNGRAPTIEEVVLGHLSQSRRTAARPGQ